MGRRFEPESVRLFDALLRQGGIALDVGANIGCTSLLFSQRAESVFAFEPSPETFALLRRNLDGAGAGNVSAINAGLGAENETATLTSSLHNRSGAFVVEGERPNEGHRSEAIEIRRGDDVWHEMGEPAVDFIKIDVEGFELSVLAGMRALLARCEPIVALEMNHFCLDVLHRITIPEFIEQLQAIFPLVYAVEGASYADLSDADERYHVMHRHVTGSLYPNLVAATDQRLLERFFAAFDHRRAEAETHLSPKRLLKRLLR